MPNNNSVIWIDDPEAIAETIENAIVTNSLIIENARKWFEIINQHPPQKASKRIWEGIKTIISKE